MFTGEEFLGRYLDLVALHEQHSNLGHGIKRVNYLQYLDEFDLFDKIPRQAKNDKYAKWVTNVTLAAWTYLERESIDWPRSSTALHYLSDTFNHFLNTWNRFIDVHSRLRIWIASWRLSLLISTRDGRKVKLKDGRRLHRQVQVKTLVYGAMLVCALTYLACLCTPLFSWGSQSICWIISLIALLLHRPTDIC